MEHDLLFKELLTTFFFEFIELFFPDLACDLDYEFGVTPITQEVFDDLALRESLAVDLLMRVKFRGHETDFLIHIENQATAQSAFPERMFRYFCHLTLRHSLPVYPIALFSYDAPKRAEPDRYEVPFPGKTVLVFEYSVIQLNRLSWRDFLERDNPVAIALMAKMKIARAERPKVKAQCLRLLAGRRLDPARSKLIWRFVEQYLRLTAAEIVTFERETAQFTVKEQETTMEYMTSWELKGIEQGKQEGKQAGLHDGKEEIIGRMVRKRFGILTEDVATRIADLTSEQLNELAVALFDFTSIADLEQWLTEHS